MGTGSIPDGRWQPAAAAGRIDATSIDNGQRGERPPETRPVADALRSIIAQVPPAHDRVQADAERALIAQEQDYGIGVPSDAYDLKLYREPDGTYTLEVHMDIEIAFLANENGKGWSASERQDYMAYFERTIETVWDGQLIPNGEFVPGAEEEIVRLDVQLDVRERQDHWIDAAHGKEAGVRQDLHRTLRALNPDPGAHWIIEAVPQPEGAFHRSHVYGQFGLGRFFGVAHDMPEREYDGRRFYQNTIAHEFGHMLGIGQGDEYQASSPFRDDPASVMHSGNIPRARHFAELEYWVDQQLHMDD